MAANAPAFFASGNITPSTFVKLDNTAGKSFHVLQCAASSDRPIGVAQDGTYYAPGVVGSDGYAAHAEQQITVYGTGEQCLLKVGAAAVVAGSYLTSDANGNAVAVAFTEPATYTVGTLIFAGAIALEDANPGELCRVVVIHTPLPGISA